MGLQVDSVSSAVCFRFPHNQRYYTVTEYYLGKKRCHFILRAIQRAKGKEIQDKLDGWQRILRTA
jgi:hypothetical protein